MKVRSLCAAMVLLPTIVVADDWDVPSGQKVVLVERLVDADGPNGLTWRYRFLATEINRDTGSVTAEAAFADIEALCGVVALPDVASAETPPDQVVINLMDRLVAYGDSAPEATQYFDGFRVDGGKCVWEGF